jgi:hypothetical protein
MGLWRKLMEKIRGIWSRFRRHMEVLSKVEVADMLMPRIEKEEEEK